MSVSLQLKISKPAYVGLGRRHGNQALFVFFERLVPRPKIVSITTTTFPKTHGTAVFDTQPLLRIQL